jgi:hypothetical protein
MKSQVMVLALALTLAAPFLAVAGKRWPSPGEPFTIQVVDEHGQPVWSAAVVADNGLVCHADGHGQTRWTESSVMNRPVRFSVKHAEFDESATVVSVTHGGHTTISVYRR